MERREAPDPERCAAVWRRVAPDLDPYPEERGGRSEAVSDDASFEEALSAALEEARSSRRAYLLWSRRAGGAAGRVRAELARGSEGQLRRLRGLYYLLTGVCWQPRTADRAPAETGGLCAFLRRQYGAETAGAARYETWVRKAEDPCLASAAEQLAQESRGRAAAVLQLLENRLAQ